MYRAVANQTPGGTNDSVKLVSKSPKSLPDTGYTIYEVLWRKKTAKKNKTWDSDGIGIHREEKLVIKTGNRLVTTIPCAVVTEGEVLAGGMYEVEVGSKQEGDLTLPVPATQPQPVKRPASENITPKSPKLLNSAKSISDLLAAPMARSSIKPASRSVPMIDPVLEQVLRPHQVEGVQFLHRIVMGNGHIHGQGALLADEMGLGKTLTTIALIFGLLKQNAIKNCLIVCPVSLLTNWKNEFRKWLGESRIGVFVATPENAVANFYKTNFKTYQVMLVGYERLRTIATQLAANMDTFDLIVCDEGHRLKSVSSKLAQAMNEISGDKRVILSGTPVQNNLVEFHALADFLNPGILGSVGKFTRKFAEPIASAREPEASDLDRERGHRATQELLEIVGEFVLRRDYKVLHQYVQVPKTELILYCKPTSQQIRLYGTAGPAVNGVWDTLSSGEALRAISILRKIATSTLLAPSDSGSERGNGLEATSGKLMVLVDLLREIARTDEKVVVVSGSTAVLDLVQNVCSSNSWQWTRLDGSTPQSSRQSIVDQFNRSGPARVFAFLLSARSGGTGLNLIGASRMILLDCDWNPAVDLQAMARIFRDGQTRPVHIYRLLTAGMIDEKMFQRQLSKTGLSDTVLDLEPVPDRFSKDELRDLFFYSPTENPLSNNKEFARAENLQLGGKHVASIWRHII